MSPTFTPILPPLFALSWQLNDKIDEDEQSREMEKRRRRRRRKKHASHPEWCQNDVMGGICPPGVEASLPLLITLYKLESDMADMRPKYNYCGLTKRYWDSGNEGETTSEIEGEACARPSVHAHTHSLQPPTHTQTQALVLPLHSLR